MSWVEKYRPKVAEDFVGNESIVQAVFSGLDNETAGKELSPHLLFVGKEGIGKTTLVGIIRIKYRFVDVLEINASKEARIDKLRTTLDKFFKTTSVDTSGKRKLLILEELDNASSAFQAAFRRDMETYQKRVLVVATANYENKITAPILSRFAVHRFKPVSVEDIVRMLDKIATREKIKFDENALRSIAEACHGKPRDALQMFQTHKGTELESSELRAKVVEIIRVVRESPVFAYKEMRKLVNEVPNARRIVEIMLEILVLSGDFSIEYTRQLAMILGKYDFQLVEGGSPDVQMASLVAELSQLFHT